jgi:hypothetical protein
MKQFLILAVAVLLAACGDDKPLADHYPGPWKSEPKPEIIRTLIAHGARHCDEFWWRTRDGETPNELTEYLVYCKAYDETEWTAWLLWPGSGRASGPTGISDGPPPPLKERTRPIAPLPR